MPGIEDAAAHGIVKAAAGLVAEGTVVRKELRDIAREGPSMKVAAEAQARRIALVQGMRLKIVETVAGWFQIRSDYFGEQGAFGTDLADKLSDTPQEYLQAPAPLLAVPAMEGLGFSLDAPDLKEMYLNLLATAWDMRSADAAHPAFADIIRQLSPGEAHLLLELLQVRNLPMVRVDRLVDKSQPAGGYEEVLRHLLDVRDDIDGSMFSEQPYLPIWVDNWVRLGLVNASYEQHLTGDDLYDWAESRPEVLRLRAIHETETAGVLIRQGVLSATDFGLSFATAVSPRPGVAEEESIRT